MVFENFREFSRIFENLVPFFFWGEGLRPKKNWEEFWEGNGLGWEGGWEFKFQNNSGLGRWGGLGGVDGVDGLGGWVLGRCNLSLILATPSPLPSPHLSCLQPCFPLTLPFSHPPSLQFRCGCKLECVCVCVCGWVGGCGNGWRECVCVCVNVLMC